MATKEELLQKMSDMVFEMEDEDIAEVCKSTSKWATTLLTAYCTVS